MADKQCADHSDGSSHRWTVVGHRGRSTDYECTWVLENEHGHWACRARQTRVGKAGGHGTDCPHHGRQTSWPCYSCEKTPWRYWTVDAESLQPWGRCEQTDVNDHGDTLRCVLLAGHAQATGHEYLCPSVSPVGGAWCWLPYDHPGDHHINRDGTLAWVDAWIGPPDRKSDEEWEALREAERREKEIVR